MHPDSITLLVHAPGDGRKTVVLELTILLALQKFGQVNVTHVKYYLLRPN